MTNSNYQIISSRFFIIVLMFLSIFLISYNSIFKEKINSFNTLTLVIYILFFIVLWLSSAFWLDNKLNFNSEDTIQDKKSISFLIILFDSCLFTIFYFLTMILIIGNSFFQTSNSNAIKFVYLFFITSINILLVFQLNSIFKQQTRPNGYVFKFLIKPVQRISNNYDTVFSIKIFSIVFIFILPFIIVFFLTKEFISSYFIISVMINVLLGSYWLGYGLYKYFIWVWGANNSSVDDSGELSNKTRNFFNLSNFRSKENQSIYFGFIFILFTILLIIFTFILNIFTNLIINTSSIELILVLYTLSLYIIAINIIGKRTETQPWFSNSFALYSFSIPFFLITALEFLLVKNQDFIIKYLIIDSNYLKIIFIAFILISVGIMIKINNNYLTKNLWKDPYESNQLLSNLKLSIDNPSPSQLSLLQKVSNALDDKDTITKIIFIYKTLIESKSETIKDDQINAIISFINNQLELTTDNELFELLFDLIHTLLDQFPKYAKSFYKINLNLLKTGSSTVKNNALNVLGHILQLENDDFLARNLYEELEVTFETPDEKLKRLVLDALSYFIQNFDEFNDKIQKFVIDKIEYETLGIATIMYSLLEKIYENTSNPTLVELTKSKLESLDSPAKIGAINFLKSNLPENETKKNLFVELLLKNLSDIDNATGVRSNIIYTLSDLIKMNKIEKSKLDYFKDFIKDEDANVKTAIVQAYSDHYSMNSVKIIDLEHIFGNAIQDNDYVVRLVVMQSIKEINSIENGFYKNFISLIQKGLTDESQPVKDIAKELLKD